MPSPKWKQVFKHNGTVLSTPVPKKGKKPKNELKVVAPSGNTYIVRCQADIDKIPLKDWEHVSVACEKFNPIS